MVYKGYNILAEAITSRAVYSLNDNGELHTYVQDIDTEPEITNYAVEEETGDIIDWTNTLEEAKAMIDKLDKGEK